jgi:hypothetical protein
VPEADGQFERGSKFLPFEMVRGLRVGVRQHEKLHCGLSPNYSIEAAAHSPKSQSINVNVTGSSLTRSRFESLDRWTCKDAPRLERMRRTEPV